LEGKIPDVLTYRKIGSEKNQQKAQMSLEIGSRVLLLHFDPERVEGVVNFFGKTHFHGGVWIGVQLDAAVGKNNGSIDGVPYFYCEPKFGIFVQYENIRKILGTFKIINFRDFN